LAGWESQSGFVRHRLVAITDQALYFDGERELYGRGLGNNKAAEVGVADSLVARVSPDDFLVFNA
jgi:hypothetical protein